MQFCAANSPGGAGLPNTQCPAITHPNNMSDLADFALFASVKFIFPRWLCGGGAYTLYALNGLLPADSLWLYEYAATTGRQKMSGVAVKAGSGTAADKSVH